MSGNAGDLFRIEGVRGSNPLSSTHPNQQVKTMIASGMIADKIV